MFAPASPPQGLSDALTQLAAGGIDVGAAGVADRRLDAHAGEAVDELLGLLGRRRLEGGARDLIQLDDVDVAERPAAEIAERIDFLIGVVHAADQSILVGRAPAGLVDVFAERRVEVHERETAYARHEGVARLLDGGVQRDGERELLGLVGEPEDLRDEAAR